MELWEWCRPQINQFIRTLQRVITFLFTFLFAANHFHRVGAASISHFPTAAIKFSCYSYDDIGLLCFLSLALALSLLSTSM